MDYQPTSKINANVPTCADAAGECWRPRYHRPNPPSTAWAATPCSQRR